MALQPAIPWQPATLGAYRATMFINDGRFEITESHWQNGGSGDAATIIPAAKDLATLRIAMLPKGCTLTEIRCSQESVYRDSSIDNSTANTPGGINSTTLTRSDCVMARLEATTFNRKMVYMGFPPYYVVKDEKWAGKGTDYETAMQAYLTKLAGPPPGGPPGPAGWGYPIVAPDKGDNATPRSAILNLTLVKGSTTALLNLKQLGTIDVGRVVRIGKVPLMALRYGINGLYNVNVVAGNVITIQLGLPSPVDFAGPVPGYCKEVYKLFSAYTKWVFLGVGDRKRGGRTFLPAGRSKRSHLLGS